MYFIVKKNTANLNYDKHNNYYQQLIILSFQET